MIEEKFFKETGMMLCEWFANRGIAFAIVYYDPSDESIFSFSNLKDSSKVPDLLQDAVDGMRDREPDETIKPNLVN